MESNKHYIIDSRSLITPHDTVFVALSTPSGNGHNYVDDLYAKGVRRFIVDKQFTTPLDKAEVNRVDDTLAELQRLAATKRRSIDEPVVAITGSRGKTTVKEWLHILLDKHTDRSPRSFNSQIGVPLSLLNMLRTPENSVVVEAGISRKGEMERLEDILKPQIVVFTSLTNEHADELGTLHDAAQEKILLAKEAKTIVYPLDNSLIASAVKQIKSTVNPTLETIGWKFTPRELIFKKADGEHRLDLNALKTLNPALTEDWEWNDVAAALGTVMALKSDLPAEVLQKVEYLMPITPRLKVQEGAAGNKIIVDSFTPDAQSLAQTFDYARRIAIDKANIHLLLLIDANSRLTMSELREIVDKAREYGVSNIQEISHYDIDSSSSPADVRKLLKDKCIEQFENSTVIIYSAARNHALPLLVSGFDTRQHETILEINLDAIIGNLNYFKSYLKPDTGIICMLKAFGYGTGSVELARTLQTQGVAALAVAVIDEGVELRQHGITCPIIVLNPRAQSLDLMIDHDLEPAIYNFDMLERIAEMAGRRMVHNFPVHVKLETGMGRLGFLEQEIPLLLEIIKNSGNRLVVKSIFSHLATADCFDMDQYTHQQIELFDRLSLNIIHNLGYKVKRHILNSAGILRFPRWQFDMARLGIGLYGVRTLPAEIETGLQPVAALYTTVISLKHWKAGTTIGYSRKGVLKRDSVIATLPVGYADGIDRRMGNGNARMMVRGVECPTVGNICMDICMIDVTDVADCAIGDRVEVFGNNIPVEDVALKLGTIPYEILTSISQRVKREYFHE